jgi:type VI protein secretion system component VasK
VNGIWGLVGAGITLVGVIVTGWFTYRGGRAAAAIQAEPSQRAEDRAAFEAIKKELREDLTATREEVKSLRSLVRAFAWYVGELTSQMRGHGIEPPAPPDRVDEYNRTGV